MAANPLRGNGRVSGPELKGQIDQRRVLRLGERQLIRALQFDAQGKIVTGFPPLERRDAGMPGPFQTRDKLSDDTVTLNQKMRRHAQVSDAFKVGVFRYIQAILEELLHLARGELPRWQADVVDHQQGDFFGWTLVEVGRRTVTHVLAPTAGGIQLHTDSFEEKTTGSVCRDRHADGSAIRAYAGNFLKQRPAPGQARRTQRIFIRRRLPMTDASARSNSKASSSRRTAPRRNSTARAWAVRSSTFMPVRLTKMYLPPGSMIAVSLQRRLFSSSSRISTHWPMRNCRIQSSAASSAGNSKATSSTRGS